MNKGHWVEQHAYDVLNSLERDVFPDLGSAPHFGCPLHGAPIVDRSMDPIGPPGSRRLPFMRDAAFHPGGVSPSRLSMVDLLPSVTGTNSASATFEPSRLLLPAPHMTPVYASDSALPQRLQDSVPACLLGFDRAGLSPVSYLQFHQRTPVIRRK